MNDIIKSEKSKLAKKNDVRSMIESDSFKSAIARVLPKHLTPDRMVQVAILAMTKVPDLKNCTPASLSNALITLSQLGLEPDGRRAHLIPFRNNKTQTTECQLIIDYKGLVEVIMRNSNVIKIHADVVCTQDIFESNKGEITKHEINYREPRGSIFAAYCIIEMEHGTKTEIMSKEEIDKIKARSKTSGYGPWVTDYNEMAKKTVFKRCAKWVPLSPEINDALVIDDGTIYTDDSFEIPKYENTGGLQALTQQLNENLKSENKEAE